jgi:hypothetical protein
MESVVFSRTLAVLGTLASVAWAGQAYALEPGTADPHEPGVTIGLPLGALPPPGFYFSNNTNYVDGSLRDGNGNPTTATRVNITAWVQIPALLWSSPFHILGAQWGVAVVQPIVTISATTNGVTQARTGLDNTLFNPAVLSWHLPGGFFVSAGIPIGLKDGDTGGNSNATQQHTAANNWIFGPAAAISWFNGHGLEVTLNGEYDIQTQDDRFANSFTIPGTTTVVPATIKYQSGNVLNLDFTVQQVLPGAWKKWQVGIGGYYAVQTTDDTTTSTIPALGINNSTATVPANFANLQNGAGMRFEKFGLGPVVGYNFGNVGILAWYTRDIFAKNTTLNDTFWFTLAVPF